MLKKEMMEFIRDESAIGVIEVVLILVVLIGLVLFFKKELNFAAIVRLVYVVRRPFVFEQRFLGVVDRLCRTIIVVRSEFACKTCTTRNKLCSKVEHSDQGTFRKSLAEVAALVHLFVDGALLYVLFVVFERIFREIVFDESIASGFGCRHTRIYR